MSPWRLWVFAFAGSLGGLAACQSNEPAAGAGGVRSSPLIQDQAHHDGVTGFYFLPPMVSSPTVQGAFDSTISPTVRIREVLDASTDPVTLGRVVVEYGRGSGVTVGTDSYQVNWKTRDFALDLGHEYRITVSSGDKVLGV